METKKVAFQVWLGLFLLAISVMGCGAYIIAGPAGGLVTSTKLPGVSTVGTQFLIPPDKVLASGIRATGQSCSHGILGLIAWGDASIQQAEYNARSETLWPAALKESPELKEELKRVEKELEKTWGDRPEEREKREELQSKNGLRPMHWRISIPELGQSDRASVAWSPP